MLNQSKRVVRVMKYEKRSTGFDFCKKCCLDISGEIPFVFRCRRKETRQDDERDIYTKSRENNRPNAMPLMPTCDYPPRRDEPEGKC